MQHPTNSHIRSQHSGQKPHLAESLLQDCPQPTHHLHLIVVLCLTDSIISLSSHAEITADLVLCLTDTILSLSSHAEITADHMQELS